MNIQETVFFKQTEQGLRQLIRIEPPHDCDLRDGCTIEIELEERGTHQTQIAAGAAGRILTALAPVAWPHLVDGRHQPLPATIRLRSGEEQTERRVFLGRHRPWTIYVCQDICTDFTWGMPDDQTKQASFDMLCAQLDEMDRTDDWPEGERNHYNLNQTMEIAWFLEKADERDQERLWRRVREGRLLVSATWNANLSALMPVEAAIDSLRYAAHLHRTIGMPLDFVEHIEMPSMADSMLQIYANAGIKYFVKNWLDFNSHYLRKTPEKPVFSWLLADGSQITTLMPRGANLRGAYSQGVFLVDKSDAEIAAILHEWWIPYYEQVEDYPCASLPLMGTYWDLNVVANSWPRRLVDAIRRYNQNDWDYPRLVNASYTQFLSSVEKTQSKLAVKMPQLSGDYGCSWEDWPQQMAHVAARMRTGSARLADLAKLDGILRWQCGDIELPSLDPGRLHLQHLYEHPWNGTNDAEKWYSYAKRLKWGEALHQELDRFAAAASDTQLQGDKITIFNPIGSARNDLLLIAGRSVHEQVGKVAGESAITSNDGSAASTANPSPVTVYCEVADTTLLAVQAEGCGSAALGWSEVVSQVDSGPTWLENDYLRLEIDPISGAIAKIADKRYSREWSSSRGLNALTYRSEGIVLATVCQDIVPLDAAPLARGLRVRVTTRDIELTTDYWLSAADDRLRITNYLHKKPSEERLNVSFDFDASHAADQVHLGAATHTLVPGTIAEGGLFLEGAGQETYACHEFVYLGDRISGLALASIDVGILQIGGDTYDLMPDKPLFGSRHVSVLALTNHAYLEMLHHQYNQADFTFRFELKPVAAPSQGELETAELITFGDLANHPCRILCEAPGKTVPPRTWIRVDTPGVLLSAVQPATGSSGQDFMIRLRNALGKPRRAEVFLDLPSSGTIVRADVLDRPLTEEPHEQGSDGTAMGPAPTLQNGRLSVSLSAYEIVTLLFKSTSMAKESHP